MASRGAMGRMGCGKGGVLWWQVNDALLACVVSLGCLECALVCTRRAMSCISLESEQVWRENGVRHALFAWQGVASGQVGREDVGGAVAIASMSRVSVMVMTAQLRMYRMLRRTGKGKACGRREK